MERCDAAHYAGFGSCEEIIKKIFQRKGHCSDAPKPCQKKCKAKLEAKPVEPDHCKHL